MGSCFFISEIKEKPRHLSDYMECFSMLALYTIELSQASRECWWFLHGI